MMINTGGLGALGGGRFTAHGNNLFCLPVRYLGNQDPHLEEVS